MGFGREREKELREREAIQRRAKDKRLHPPFALHAPPRHQAMLGYVIQIAFRRNQPLSQELSALLSAGRQIKSDDTDMLSPQVF